jgi:hypothetical protein
MVRPDRFELLTYWFVEIQTGSLPRTHSFTTNNLR